MKTLRIGEKYDIRGENFRKLLAFAAAAKEARPQISRKKLSRFLPRKLPAIYGI